jgi:four helix bundle protein
LAYLVYEVSEGFPCREYRLAGQVRGAAVSVFGNIAEGYGRNAIGDYIQKKLDGSWDRGSALREAKEFYSV